MPKFLTLCEVTSPERREAYVKWAVLSWKNGYFQSLCKEFALVFPENVIQLAAQRSGWDTAPNRQSLLSFLKVFADPKGVGVYSDRAIFLSKIAARLLIEAQADADIRAERDAARNVSSSAVLQPRVHPVAAPRKLLKQAATVPKEQPKSEKQRAEDALATFLENPNDNNHMRLSRLLSAYAASHAGKIRQDYVPASERSESIRAFSGGRCSPR